MNPYLLAVLAVFSCPASAFWISDDAASHDQRPSNISPSSLLQSGTQRSELFQLALADLQKLESEPLCHRVAARLLVNNCQLLEGKDDATMHTDSGRKARDFVDSYAASLAICDLERASFAIPQACEPFREPTLSRIPLSDTAQLHVPASHVRACLAGLGASPSAWNTWVSYSHKALRFCEAARSDHEKTQNIRVFQKLTRTMATLADDVEADLQRRIAAWELIGKQTDGRLRQTMPAVDLILQRLQDMDDMFENRLDLAFARAVASADDAAHAAETLQQLLTLMVKTALEGNSQLAFSHEQAMERFHGQAASDLGALATDLTAAVKSAVALHEQLDDAHIRVDSLAIRQDHLEQGLQRLSGMAQTFMTSLDGHSYLLAQASNMTTEMLDTLEATAAASIAIQQAHVGRYAVGRWWPYFACPVVSIVMGSYGLPPSVLRNFGLFAVGEAVGLFVSYASHLGRAAAVMLSAYGNATTFGL